MVTKQTTTQKKVPRKYTTKKSTAKVKSSCESLIKWKLFEIIIAELLERSWFTQDLYSNQLTQNRKKLHWSWATYDHDFCWALTIWIPFLNPIMLVWEAKFYEIKLPTAREFLWAYTDLSQFTKLNTKLWWDNRYKQLFEPRYDYCPVMFSYKWFNNSAKGLLYTHWINFISYQESDVFRKLSDMYWEILTKLDYKKIKTAEIRMFFNKVWKIIDLMNVDAKVKKEWYNEIIQKMSDYLQNINSYIAILDNRFTVNILSIRKQNEKHLFDFKKHSSLRYVWNGKFEIRTKQWKTIKAEFCLPEWFIENYYKYIQDIKDKWEKKISEWKLKLTDFIDPLPSFCKSLSVVIKHDDIVDIIWCKIDENSHQSIIDTCKSEIAKKPIKSIDLIENE